MARLQKVLSVCDFVETGYASNGRGPRNTPLILHGNRKEIRNEEVSEVLSEEVLNKLGQEVFREEEFRQWSGLLAGLQAHTGHRRWNKGELRT